MFFGILPKSHRKYRNGNLPPELFWLTVRKSCSSDREKLLKFEDEGWEFSKLIKVFWHRNGILLPKLFWPTVRKSCSSDREKVLKFEAVGQDFAKVLKFEAEGREFWKILRSLKQFVQSVTGQNNFW